MGRSILIIQTGFLGDAVLASGMLRAINTVEPESSVGLLVRTPFASLYKNHPALNWLRQFEKKKKGETARIVQEVRSAGFETILLPHRSFRSAMIAARSGVPQRIGFRQGEGRFLLTERVEYDISLHETERNALLLEQIGIKAAPENTRLWLEPESGLQERMRDAYADERPIILVAPGSVWKTKQWGVAGYTSLVSLLEEMGKHVMLVGSEAEKALCSEIAEGVGLSSTDVLAGQLSLPEMVALCSIAERVMTNDSAPLHIAESVGTSVTAIFGPTVPEFGFGPLGEQSVVAQTSGLECRPCRIHGSEQCPIGTHQCMTEITAETVANTVALAEGQAR